MSVTAYQKAQQSAESARTTEYRLFAQVTAALLEAGRAGRADIKRLIDAIDWNRRLWSALASDCASDGNQLPVELRAQIISIAIWVSRYSSTVVQEGSAIGPLIEVNKNIMAGLAERNASAAANAAGA
jgi:flagellar protein FlaF